MSEKIAFSITICATHVPTKIMDVLIEPGETRYLELPHEIHDDILTIKIPGSTHEPSLGSAANLLGVSISITPRLNLTVGIYDNLEMNLGRCIACCGNGCCVSGYSSCSCGEIQQ